MARLPRLTIGMLMAVVTLLAVDFGIIRAYWGQNGPGTAIAIVTLPMIDLLILSLPRLNRSNPTRRFWFGFHAVGWIMVLIYCLLIVTYDGSFFWPIFPLERRIPKQPVAVYTVLIFTSVFVIYTTPILLLAVLAGRLLAKYRIVIERI